MNELITWFTRDWQTALIAVVGAFIALVPLPFLTQTLVPALRLKSVLRWRATTLATTLFTKQAVVGASRKNKLYKHGRG